MATCLIKPRAEPNHNTDIIKVTTTTPRWLDTIAMAERLGIHQKTLLRINKQSVSPFVEGTHFRRRGLTDRAPFQWEPDVTEKAFTNFQRIPAAAVETFSRAEALT